jgi:hypothetical protein
MSKGLRALRYERPENIQRDGACDASDQVAARRAANPPPMRHAIDSMRFLPFA